MSENREIYTAGKNFTLPLAVTAGQISPLISSSTLLIEPNVNHKNRQIVPPGHQSRSLSGGFHCTEAPVHRWSGCDQRSNQPGFMYLIFAFHQTLMAIRQSIHFLLVLSHTSGMYLVVTSKFSLPLM